MIGKIDPNLRKVTVVGGGIAGLLAAYQLDKKGYEVTLHEAQERVGGLIQTKQTPFGIAESAAHSFLATPLVEQLCKELGVELIPVRPESKARYIFRDGRQRRFPLRFMEVVRTFFRAYFVLSVLNPKATLAQWAERHLGSAALAYLLNPFLRGVFAARPNEISVAAAFPALVIPPGHSLLSYLIARKFTQRHRYPKPVKKKMVAPALGMGELITRLEQTLRDRLGSRFRTGSKLTKLPEGENIILCIPAYEAARLMQGNDKALSQKLSEVIYAPLVSMTAFVDQKTQFRGVGVLVPEKENEKCLGILFNSSAFTGRVGDEKSTESFTLMFGGTGGSKWIEATDPELAKAATEALQRLIKPKYSSSNSPSIRYLEIHRWEKSIPVYSVSLTEVWDLAARTWCKNPGRILFGNYTGQVSLRGMIEASFLL